MLALLDNADSDMAFFVEPLRPRPGAPPLGPPAEPRGFADRQRRQAGLLAAHVGVDAGRVARRLGRIRLDEDPERRPLRAPRRAADQVHVERHRRLPRGDPEGRSQAEPPEDPLRLERGRRGRGRRRRRAGRRQGRQAASVRGRGRQRAREVLRRLHGARPLGPHRPRLRSRARDPEPGRHPRRGAARTTRSSWARRASERPRSSRVWPTPSPRATSPTSSRTSTSSPSISAPCRPARA